jgi:hypothetical protein
MSSITGNVLNWNVPFCEEWVTQDMGYFGEKEATSVLNKGNLVQLKEKSLVAYLMMQKKCGDWYLKCNDFIYATTPGDLSAKSISILGKSSDAYSDFIRLLFQKKSTETINRGLNQCIASGVSPREIAQDYLDTLQRCSAQEGFKIEEEVREKIQGIINSPKESWVSLKTAAIAFLIIGVVVAGGAIISRNVSQDIPEKPKRPLRLLTGATRFKSLTSLQELKKAC